MAHDYSENPIQIWTTNHVVAYQPQRRVSPDTPCIEVTRLTDTDITLDEAYELRRALDDVIDAARLDIRLHQLGIYPADTDDDE